MSQKNNNANVEKVSENQEKLTFSNAKAEAEAILSEFEKISSDGLTGLTQEYLELKQNTTYNLIFTGMSTFKSSEGKGDVEAVLLVDKSAKQYINGNTVLVNSLKRVTAMPCLVRIVTGDMIKSSNGNYKYLDMDVIVLPKSIEKP
jgi:hypothetical protein